MGKFMGILNQGKHEAIDGIMTRSNRHGTINEQCHGPGIKHHLHKPSLRKKG